MANLWIITFFELQTKDVFFRLKKFEKAQFFSVFSFLAMKGSVSPWTFKNLQSAAAAAPVTISVSPATPASKRQIKREATKAALGKVKENLHDISSQCSSFPLLLIL